MESPPRSAYERLVIRLAARRWFSVFGRFVLSPVDRALHRLGLRPLSQVGTRFPTVFLTTTGARSGRARTVPLLGIEVWEGFGPIASNFGRERRPGWCLNLLGDPACTIEHDGEARRYRARPADPATRDEIWRRALEIYPVWSLYSARVHRRIDVFHAVPADDPA